MGWFNKSDETKSAVISTSDNLPEVEDMSTWEREAHKTIPSINLDNCTYEEYSVYQSSVRLANTFSNPGENSSFLEEGKSYSEHLDSCYQKDVLKRGFLGLW